MLWHITGKRILYLRLVPRPELLDLITIRKWQVDKALVRKRAQAHLRLLFRRPLIEKADCQLAVFQRFHENVDQAVPAYAAALDTQRVLVDGDHFAVGKNRERLIFRIHRTVRLHEFADIVAEDQRRGHHAPKGKVGFIFLIGQVSVANLQHIGIVPAAGARILIEPDVVLIDAEHRNPIGLDIRRGTPEVARLAPPLIWLVPAPLADGIDDRLLRLTCTLRVFLRGLFEQDAHIFILQRGAVEARSDGVVNLDGIPACLKLHAHLDAACRAPGFRRRHVHMVFVHPVDRDHAEFCHVILFAQADGQHIFTRFLHDDIPEGNGALIRIQPSHILAAVERFVLHDTRAALQ